MPLSCSEVPVTTILHLRAISGKRASKLLNGTIHLIYRLAAPGGLWTVRALALQDPGFSSCHVENRSVCVQ